MTTNTITADDTFTVYGRVLNDFADGDASTITFPNELFTLKTGKNRNSIFTKNANGENADVVLRVVRGSGDDKFLASQLAQIDRDFPSAILASGEFVKRLGDGNGSVTRDVYTMGGGMISKRVDAKENVEGDTDQGVASYTLKFATVTRSLQ